MTAAGAHILERARGPISATSAVAILLLADIVLGIRPYVSVLLTVAQSLLVLPWALTVFALEEDERVRPLARRVRIVAVHLITLALVALCLVVKGVVLNEAGTHGAARYLGAYRTYSAGATVFFLVGFFARGSRLGRFFGSVAEHPARLMAISFGLAATLGGFTLTLPQALRRIDDASFIDGFFTATSAVCVTGLSVNDLASTYTFFGQAVILLLVQAGGLGIMVLSSFFTLLAGTRMRVRSSAVLAEMIDADSLAGIKRNVIAIVSYTLLIEAVGACLLFLALPAASSERLWHATFHAVSAFCNAGFALFPGNFAPFVTSWPPCLLIGALTTAGGLGFPVLDELGQRVVDRLRRRRPRKLSLHARVVLGMSATLVATMTCAFLVLESTNSMRHLPYHARLLAALFHAIATRSGGFATIDFGTVGPATLAVCCIAMFIGGSPGGAAGGIKTTTFATLLATFRAEVRGEKGPRLFDRSPPNAVVRRAIGVTFFAASLLAVIIVALLVLEPLEPLALVFEAVSAFATVGLSTGITASLTVPGKLVLIAAMFVGRIGPMTFALALATRMHCLPYDLPEERISIG